MEEITGKGGGTKLKAPDGLLCYRDPRDKNKYPKRFWCVQGHMTATKCPALWRALGPAPEQLKMITPHKENCQRSLPPPENELMKEELKSMVLAYPNRKMTEIYEDVQRRCI